MIGASSMAGDGRQDLEGRSDQAPEDLQPFSHDSHFSVSPHAAPGYRFQVIDAIIVLGGAGQIVAVEHPALPAGERRSRGAMLVPVAAAAGRRDPSGFLWGRSDSLLGLGGARPGTFDAVLAAEEHLNFKALHQRVLDGVGDMALQAFLRFLDRKTAWAVRELPVIGERPRCKLAFRFQYDEHYLHERHAAQLAWRRFLAACPPGEDGAPARAARADASVHWSPKA